MWRNRSLPVASHAAARVPIRIERRAFPSLSIPDTRERCERRARLETLTPRDNTDLALVNSGYSKTKLRRGCSGVSLSEFIPNQTRRLCRSVTHAGPMGRPRHLIESGKYRQTGIFVWVFSVCDALQRYFGKSAESSGSGTPAAIPNRAFVVRPNDGSQTGRVAREIEIGRNSAAPHMQTVISSYW